MGQLPEAPVHALAEVHLRPAHRLDELRKLDAESRIQNAKTVARIFEIEQQHRARCRTAIPRFMLDRITKDHRLSFLPTARFVSDTDRACRVRLESKMKPQDVARVLIVADVRFNMRARREA